MLRPHDSPAVSPTLTFATAEAVCIKIIGELLVRAGLEGILAMLSQQELDCLLNLLKEANKPFEAIATTFYKNFSKQEQFKAGCVICMLIQDNLLTQTQRLVGFYLLYDIYRNDSLPTTPFVPLVVEVVEQTNDVVERKFLLQFLSSLPKELPKQSVQSFLQSCDAEHPAIPDLDAFRRMHQERVSATRSSSSVGPGSAQAALGVRPVINDRSDEGFWVSEENDPTGLELNPEELTLLSLEPAWSRPVPPLLEPTVDEEPLWDYTMCADTSRGAEVRELIAKAVKTPLPSNQAQVIFDGLAQEKLMGGSQISHYFTALVNMEMSLHSMEVVNRLTTSVDLPPEFAVQTLRGATAVPGSERPPEDEVLKALLKVQKEKAELNKAGSAGPFDGWREALAPCVPGHAQRRGGGTDACMGCTGSELKNEAPPSFFDRGWYVDGLVTAVQRFEDSSAARMNQNGVFEPWHARAVLGEDVIGFLILSGQILRLFFGVLDGKSEVFRS
eukprot:g26987.t1